MERISELCSGLKMTVVGGVFLAVSLVLSLTGVQALADPAWVTLLICGCPLLYHAVRKLVRNPGMQKISSALLISIAMLASIAIGELFAAGEVAFIMAIGEILEDKTVERAQKGIRQLVSLQPAQARRIIDGREETVPVERVALGDILRVRPGEAIPVDGEIVSGSTSVDQSVITGESLPADKSAGDGVFCGTINRFGSIDLRATQIGEDSSLQKLVRMVREAENNKAPMQRLADQWASWLVPAALFIAAAVCLVTRNVTQAVTVLVVFCPCALVLATPASVMAAIGQAAKNGVLIKSGEALERMGKVNCVAFDKTGTLTHGRLAVSDLVSFDPELSENALLSLTASAESLSEHPLGRAVVAQAQIQGAEIRPPADFRMIPGKGVRAEIDGRPILCGSGAYLSECGVTLSGRVADTARRLREEGKAAVLTAQNGICVGLAALSDTLRTSASRVVSELKAARSDSVLLTGDHKQTAEYFAARTGIFDVYAELLPDQKVQRIRELQRTGRTVCMVGDGVNDAPALKTADVGVAMGGMGSDIAVEAADIALMGDDITKLPYLKRLSNATVRLIKLNIALSLGINILAIVLSVLSLLNPITGALVHNVGAVLVVLNATRLYDRKYA